MDRDRPELHVFPKRYIAKNIQATGWQIWDRVDHKWWGRPYRKYPAELLAELNGPKRPERLAELSEDS